MGIIFCFMCLAIYGQRAIVSIFQRIFGWRLHRDLGLIGAEGVFLYQNRQLFGRRFGSAIGNVIFIIVVNLVIDLFPAAALIIGVTLAGFWAD